MSANALLQAVNVLFSREEFLERFAEQEAAQNGFPWGKLAAERSAADG